MAAAAGPPAPATPHPPCLVPPPCYDPGMRFLVTGATGFVGGAVARRLLADGEDVVVLARDEARSRDLAARGAQVRVGTIGDPNEVADAAKGAEVVVHAAAVASHRAAPEALAWVNVAGTENVVNAARHVGCARVVYGSCGDVSLVDADRVHLGEDAYATRRPFDGHARSKRLAEEVALSGSDHEIEVTAVRPAFLWGPGDTTNLPWICRWGMRGGLRLPGGGDNLFATTYVDHLVDAVLSAAEVTDAVGRAYHVADNVFVTAREFFRELSAAVGLPPPRSGWPYPAARAAAEVARALRSDAPWPTDVVRLGRSTQLDVQASVDQLHLPAQVDHTPGMAAVAAWARDVGGPAAIAALGRPAPDAASVSTQMAAAGG